MTEPDGGWAAPGWTPPVIPPTAQPVWTDLPTAPPPPRAPARPGVIPLRPLAVGELLDGAFAVIRRHPRPVLGMSAAVAVVTTAVDLAVTRVALDPLLHLDSARPSTDQLDGVLGAAAVGMLAAGSVSLVGATVLAGLVTAVTGRAVLGKPADFTEAWAQARPAIGRLLAIALLTALAVFGIVALAAGAIAAIAVSTGPGAAAAAGVPLGFGALALAALLYVRLSLAPVAAVLERTGVWRSLTRSARLVRGSWWRTCGVLVLAMLITSFVGYIVQVPFVVAGAGPAGLLGGGSTGDVTTRMLVVSGIAAAFAQTLVGPFAAGVRALLYIDRRMRTEALDVSLAAAASPAE